jgi:hypothetical protein
LWDKKRTKNGLKVKTKKAVKMPKMPKMPTAETQTAETQTAETQTPVDGKRWGGVRRSGWSPKTGTGE